MHLAPRTLSLEAIFACVTLSFVGAVFAQSVAIQNKLHTHPDTPVTRLQLISLPDVQSSLKVSSAQKAMIVESLALHKNVRKERIARRDDQGMPFPDGPELKELARQARDADVKLMRSLDKSQAKRLTEIFVQSNGAYALLEPEVQKHLSLSDVTIAEINIMLEDRRILFPLSLRGVKLELREAEKAKFNKKTSEHLLSALSVDQKAALEKLCGEPIELNLSQIEP